MAADPGGELADQLRRLSVSLPEALAEIAVPAAVLDREGIIRWMNAAAIETFGDRRGEHFTVVVAPESRQLVTEQFARKIIGRVRVTDYEAVFLARDGRRYLVDVDTVRLEDAGAAIGVFGIVEVEHPLDGDAARAVRLTPRQLDVLRLLAGGSSTEAIAQHLSVSKQTVRNHVRGILRALGVHSRLQAVLHARELGIV